ncbi:MAG: hypothetical protein RLZZ226_1179 [Pseudomonadota bacterium]
MALIKDGQPCPNDWQHLDDSETLPALGPVTVSLKRWQSQRDGLNRDGQPLGIRLEASDSPEALGDMPQEIPLIVLDMQAFTDGRSFSQAQWIRERLGYTGELRVRGDFLLDQVFYLARVGVNAFEFSDASQAQQALPRLHEFSVRYQAANDVKQPLYRYRNTAPTA